MVRRLLYGVSGFAPFEEFCKSLEALKELPFDTVYSTHDRCSLSKGHIDLMLRQIGKEFMKNYRVYENPPFGTMCGLSYGDTYTKDYFDMAAPLEFVK